MTDWRPGCPVPESAFAFDCETDVPPTTVRLAAAYAGDDVIFIRPDDLDAWFAAAAGPALAHTSHFDRRMTRQPFYEWVEVSRNRMSLADMADFHLGRWLPKPPEIRLNFNPDDPDHRVYLADDVRAVWDLAQHLGIL